MCGFKESFARGRVEDWHVVVYINRIPGSYRGLGLYKTDVTPQNVSQERHT